MSEIPKNKVRLIAFYLPQFHPIPENDEWWGKGFTEWTNVGKAKPLFKGHYQPRVPADLGYYDLRVPEVREAQAQLAKEYGIEGFCYWHYWFGNGKRLLERPFNEVLESGKPDFPFCLAWANESWKGLAHGLSNRDILIEQLYLGEHDYIAHFYTVLPAFKDSRYITVDGLPLFMIYKPMADPEVIIFMNIWRKLALKNGLKGIYFVGHCNEPKYTALQIVAAGFDGVNTNRLVYYVTNHLSFAQKVRDHLFKIHRGVPLVYSYRVMSKYFLIPDEDTQENVFPSIFPGWDHTPRSGKDGLVLSRTSPELFKNTVGETIKMIEHKHPQHKIIFVKSWNEWAEGNYLEPDLKWGNKFLEALKPALEE